MQHRLNPTKHTRIDPVTVCSILRVIVIVHKYIHIVLLLYGCCCHLPIAPPLFHFLLLFFLLMVRDTFYTHIHWHLATKYARVLDIWNPLRNEGSVLECDFLHNIFVAALTNCVVCYVCIAYSTYGGEYFFILYLGTWKKIYFCSRNISGTLYLGRFVLPDKHLFTNCQNITWNGQRKYISCHVNYPCRLYYTDRPKMFIGNHLPYIV